MKGKRIVIIGGSIAGCAAAVMLQRYGAEITVLEKSAGRIGQGVGVTLPEHIVNQCIEHDLFDKDIPCHHVCGRSFLRADGQQPAGQQTFWQQSIRALMFNWVDIYRNLRKRVRSEAYYTNAEVCSINKIGSEYQLETGDGRLFVADLIIAADGIDSAVRSYLFPNVHPEYTGYIAWRGVIDESNIANPSFFSAHVPYYVFPQGHILLYRIPAADYQHTGKSLLNWVMYEDRSNDALTALLVDNQGRVHPRSLPAGTLTNEHLADLHQLAQLLPNPISELIVKTPQPFIQAVFDFQLPAYASNQILFLGDAAATLRPHSASGVFKALTNSLELFSLLNSESGLDFPEQIALWKERQQELLAEESQKAKCMGDALVKSPPNWNLMNQETTEQWWAMVMQGKNWYATSAPEDVRSLANA